MTDASSPEDALTQFVARAEEAASTFMGGDMDRYLELVQHARGYTLLNPLGGGPARFDDRTESLKASAGYFRAGETKLEQVQTHAWGDTIVLVMIERQHGEVGSMPDQDWSLRVPHVYRREGSDWLLVHRHDDPLVHRIELEQMAGLARDDQLQITPTATET